MKRPLSKVGAKTILCIYALTLLFTSTLLIGHGKALPDQGTTYLRVEPTTPISATIGVTFQINVTVVDVENLYSFDFKFTYNTTILDCLEDWIVITPFLNEPTDKTLDVREVDGVIRIAVSSMNPAEPKSGSGPLVSIAFNVTNIGLTKLDLVDTKLWDQDENPIVHIAEAGWIESFRTMLAVEPSRSSAMVGESLAINITVSEVENLYGWEFKFQWDPTLLEVATYKFGYPDVPFLNSPTYKLDKSDPTNGSLWLAESSYLPAKAKNGSGTLATFTFNVLDKGSCVLDLYDTKLAPPTPPPPLPPIIEPIPHCARDGYFNNVPTFLSITPQSIKDTTLEPGRLFTINVTVSSVEDLYSYEFKLRYDTGVLNATDATILPFLNEPTTVTKKEIDTQTGTVWLAVTSSIPAEPKSGDGHLVSIAFNVTAFGTTLLDLVDTKLWDQDENPIAHNIVDGKFANWRNVAVTAFKAAPDEVKVRGLIYINITVTNIGAGTESFNVTVSFNSTAPHTEVFSGNATAKTFMLTYVPIYPNSEAVHIDDAPKERDVDYAINSTNGNLTFYSAPPDGSNITVQYRAYEADRWEVIATELTTDLTPGNSTTSTFIWNTTDVDPASYQLRAEVTLAIDDYLADNEATLIVTIKPFVYDVAVVNTISMPQMATLGENVYFQVFVKNKGTEPATFNCTILYDNTIIGTKINITLQAGHGRIFKFIWNTAGIPLGVYNITSVASLVEGEIETDNNTHLIRVWITSPTQPLVFSTELIIATIVIIAVLSVGIIYFARLRIRRR